MIGAPVKASANSGALSASASPREGVKIPYRLRGLLICAGAVAVLIAGLWVTPAESGHGTHQQLGVPPCSFLVTTGWPCPSCGVTTSLAAMARGRVSLAWKAQPFGIAVFGLLVLLFIVGGAELICNRSILSKLHPGLWWIWAALGSMMLGWGIKVLSGYIRGEYPLT